MQKIIKLTVVLSVISLTASAQYRLHGRMYGGSKRYSQQRSQPNRRRPSDNFKPSVTLSLGYGFPNLDKNSLLEFYNFYPGKATQQGPYIGSLDYQFSRSTSIGVSVNYGKVTMPYYHNNDISTAFNGKLENTAIMLNLVRYIPATRVISPYFKTAIGINIPHSSYKDAAGVDTVLPTDDNTLAYQVSLGLKINFTPRAGLFAEAGYGKYIIAGGISLKF